MRISSRDDFIDYLDSSFSRISPDDDYDHAHLKSYLIESNIPQPPAFESYTEWMSIGDDWYVCYNAKDFIVIDCSDSRIWILYTLSKVTDMDQKMKQWVNNKGLDRCWFSKTNFSALERLFDFQERGVGLRFKNSISECEDPFGFSLKAWYGSGADENVESLFNNLKDKFATTSVRWRKISGGNTTLRLECFNNGKITVNYMEDVEETLSFISQTSELYRKALDEGEKARKAERSAFEFNYKQPMNLEEYSKALSRGNNKLKLWMYEYESCDNYRRFTGIDLHNNDRLLLDMGEGYAYMSVPGNGCVNAAPRFATIQGENACGNVKVLFEGRDIFDFRQI